MCHECFYFRMRRGQPRGGKDDATVIGLTITSKLWRLSNVCLNCPREREWR
jgi:hypothetical protein